MVPFRGPEFNKKTVSPFKQNQSIWNTSSWLYFLQTFCFCVNITTPPSKSVIKKPYYLQNSSNNFRKGHQTGRSIFLKFFIFLILKSLIPTCVPKHEPPSHLPPHNISLGHPHAPAPSMLYPASDIDWRFDSFMIVYMLECHSPKSSHPLPLPLSPKVRYTQLCLFCCLAYRVVIAIFLNSIYMC